MINVVYLAWNRREFTELSLASIEKHTNWDAVHKFLLLDDFSEDGTGEVCQEWARGKAKVEVIRRHNTTMCTGEPFAWAGEQMGGDCWTVLVPNDCGFCEDVFGAFDSISKDDADVLNSLPVHRAPDDPEHWSQKHHTIPIGHITGGLVAIAPDLIHTIHERFVSTKAALSTWGIFHVLLPKSGITVRERRIIPPMRCVFFDDDLRKPHSVVQTLLDEAGIHHSHVLALTTTYASKGWVRLRIASDGKTLETSEVRRDREAHRWV